MSERPRLEMAGTVAALLICAAFVASFAFGLGRSGTRDAGPALEPALNISDAPAAAGRVEVLNGSGRGGIARAVTHELRTAGYDVVYFGNAPASAGDSSVVIDRSGDDAIARAVAQHLGIASVRAEPDSTLFLEATVILGRDWRANR
jgi:hypothetical protein